MNTELFFDIMRIVLLVIQILSAGITVVIFLITKKVSAKTLLTSLLKWYESSMEDGKISAEEMVECLKMIQNLSKISDNETTTSTETKEDSK